MLRAAGMKQKMKLGPAHHARAGDARPLQAGARHARRPVPLGRGAQARAGDDPRVRATPCAQLATRLTAANLDEAVAIASLPDQVRGYEHLKLTAPPPTAPSSPPAWPPSADRDVSAGSGCQAAGLPPHCQVQIGHCWVAPDARGLTSTGLAAATRRAAPTMPASFSRAAGTISVPTSMQRHPLVGLPAGAAADDDQLGREQLDDDLEVALRPAWPSPSTTGPRGRGPTPPPCLGVVAVDLDVAELGVRAPACRRRTARTRCPCRTSARARRRGAPRPAP